MSAPRLRDFVAVAARYIRDGSHHEARLELDGCASLAPVEWRALDDALAEAAHALGAPRYSVDAFVWGSP